MAENLAPCQFCAGNKTHFGSVQEGRVYVVCSYCLSSGTPRPSKAEAIHAWNRRAKPAAVAAVPVGYALVPKEPTAEMLRVLGFPEGTGAGFYRNMLAAAEAPNKEGKDE